MKFDIGLPQSASGEGPPVKKLRRSVKAASKAVAKMLYKTKLCSKFRAGTCVTDCRFAHGMEELRRPPPNWQEIVAARGDELRKVLPNRKEIVAAREEDEAVSVEPGEGFQTPSLCGEDDAQHCKQFYTEEGCPYGDGCTFVHDEQAKARGSEAITIESDMPSNSKTKVCSKWETMGYCPFQNRCHFAHGFEDLRVVHGESELGMTLIEAKQGVLPPKTPAEVVAEAAGALPLSEGEERSRKEKIREIISILQSMIPGGKDKDVVEVIDEAIEYLNSLKVKARDLGLDTL